MIVQYMEQEKVKLLPLLSEDMEENWSEDFYLEPR